MRVAILSFIFITAPTSVYALEPGGEKATGPMYSWADRDGVRHYGTRAPTGALDVRSVSMPAQPKREMVDSNASRDRDLAAVVGTGWRPVYESQEAWVDVNWKSAIRTGDLVETWVRTTYVVPRKLHSLGYVKYEKSLSVFDCKRRTDAGKETVYLAASGTVMARYPDRDRRPVPIVPDTVQDLVWTAVCAG
jgi:hypothetical protein